MQPDSHRTVRRDALVVGPFAVEIRASEPWADVLPELLSGYVPGVQRRPTYGVSIALERARRSHHGFARFAHFRRDGDAWIDSSEMWDAHIALAPDGVSARFALCDDPPVGDSPRSVLRRALVAGAIKVTLALAAPRYDGLLVHAAASVRPDARALVFCGPSGEGKTTMPCRLSGWRTLSDDVALLYRDASRRDAGWRVSGTPLRGREGLPRRAEDAPLAGIVHLAKGSPALALEPLDTGGALAAMLSRIFYFAAPDAAVLSVASATIEAVPSHRLRSSLEHDPAPLLMGIGS